MSWPFDRGRGLIVVPTEVVGPNGSAIVRLALDTGATRTLINSALLMSLGYGPNAADATVEVTTGSGVEFVPLRPVTRLTALGQERRDFGVISHTLPPSAGVDGLLGLDFLRGRVLTIDFRNGQVDMV